jgi:hypothetical protein
VAQPLAASARDRRKSVLPLLRLVLALVLDGLAFFGGLASLAKALSAPAPQLRTLAPSPASAPSTALSFSVIVLPLLRLALALVLNVLAFLGGFASLGGPRASAPSAPRTPPELSALAQLPAMPTRAVAPASAPTTALSFSVGDLTKVVVLVCGDVDEVRWF